MSPARGPEVVRKWSGTSERAFFGVHANSCLLLGLGCQVFRRCRSSSPGPLVSGGTRSLALASCHCRAVRHAANQRARAAAWHPAGHHRAACLSGGTGSALLVGLARGPLSDTPFAYEAPKGPAVAQTGTAGYPAVPNQRPLPIHRHGYVVLRGVTFIFSNTSVMEKGFPKLNVAAQWKSDCDLFTVQIVEIAENAMQQMFGGTDGIACCSSTGTAKRRWGSPSLRTQWVNCTRCSERRWRASLSVRSKDALRRCS